MTEFFVHSEAALRYDKYRPKVHSIAVQWLHEVFGDRHWSKAIDIACGTGDSTVPLTQVADVVLGIDASPEMLRFAERKGLTVKHASYDAIDVGDDYDLITTCMAFHWFNPSNAIHAYKRLSADRATWLIYNFAFAGHSTNEAFNKWLKESYLVEFPSPPRFRMSNTIPGDDPELQCIYRKQGELPLPFDCHSLVGYFTTQSNIEAAVARGLSYQSIESRLRDQLQDFDLTGDFRYQFTCEIHEFTRSVEENR